jgi:glycosyltransferase involved in cell wall biosynthesis
MNQNLPISIIVPAYNSQETIQECLRSIFSQDYPNIELIVTDDASKDMTLKKLEEFKNETNSVTFPGKRDILIITTLKNHGSAYSRNIGANAATSETLLFIDSDILVPPGAIRAVSETLLTKPEFLAIGAIYSENTRRLNFISDFKNLDLSYRGRLCTERVKYLGSFFIMIKRSVFLQAGGFKETFHGSTTEDIEFGYRVTKDKNLMFINKNISVDHLKKYTLYEMLKTDFNRVTSMMRIIKDSEGKYKAGEHASLTAIINLFLPGLILLSLLISLKFKSFLWAIAPVLGFIVNNSGFLAFLMKRRSVGFMIKSLFVLFIEYLVVSLSIFLSLFVRFKNKKDE